MTREDAYRALGATEDDLKTLMLRRGLEPTRKKLDELLARAVCLKALAHEHSCSLEVADTMLKNMAQAERAFTDPAEAALACARAWSGNDGMGFAEAAEYLGRVTEAYSG